MVTPDGRLPCTSNSAIVADIHGDNDGWSGCTLCDDDEEGEPPSILFNTISSSTDHASFTGSIVTFCRPHCRLKPTRSQRRCGRYFSLMSTIVVTIVLYQLSAASAEADAAYGISSIYKEMHPSIFQAGTSPGIRGAITFSEDESIVSHPSENCNYDCCTSFPDMIHNLSSTETRMLQTSTTTSNPCPADNETNESEGGVAIPVGVQYFLIVILVMFSALFSGLTLGLMSLDPSGLEIVMANSDDPRLARAAKAIYPVRLNGNLLLCTLLLGNVGVNSMLSILMADLTSGLVGFIVSTAVIVIFGEIIPQAICSRYALQVGEKTVPIVKVIMALLYPICKPLSMILNKVLGHEIGTTYSTSEIAKLIEMHVKSGGLEGDQGAAMTGALRFRGILVNEVMTPLVNTFMLSADERLGFDTVAKIFKTGFSRIPVYEVSKSNIIGLLFVKDLIFLDPEDEIPVKNFVQIFGRGLHIVWHDDKLGDILKLLKRGRSHMALVRDVNDGDGEVDPYYEIKGIITLEDIIEIILGDEIFDETDELADSIEPDSHSRRSDIIGGYVEGSGRDSPVLGGGVSPLGGASVRGSSRAIDWESRLRLLDERLVDEHLSPDEVRAVAAHLKTNYSKAVELISDRQLKELLSLVAVTEILPASTCATEDGGDDGGSGVPTDSGELIYERGVPADFCTVVLSGKIMVVSGADKFRSDVSNWGVLACRALTDPSYVPDFSAWVLPNQNSMGGCRCVKLDRKSFCAAVDNTALEKTDHNVQPAVAMSTIITQKSPLVLNGGPGEEVSTSLKGTSPGLIGLGSDNLTPTKAGDDTKQVDTTLLQPQTTTLLPPQTALGDVMHVEHTTPSYVRTDIQKKTHSRRSKLLKAFTRATRKSEKKND